MIKTEIFLCKDDPNRDWKDQSECRREKEFLHAVQGEAGSEQLEFHLMQNREEPFDLTGSSVAFYLTKPDGGKIFLSATVPSDTAAQGIAAVTLTAQCTAAAGIANHGEVRVTASDGSVLKFPAPDIFISSSDTEGALESTSEFQALDLALSRTEESLQNSESALSSAQQVLDSDRTALSEIGAAAANANSGAEAANQAASSASNAATAANAAAQAATDASAAASSAAESAGNSAQACNSVIADITAAAQAEVNKHASRTDNPHQVTAAQIGAASSAAAFESLTPSDGLRLGNNPVCIVAVTDTVKIISAELISTTAIPGYTALLHLPNVQHGYLPRVLFVNGSFCYAWLYEDGTLKTMQDIPADAVIVISFSYI